MSQKAIQINPELYQYLLSVSLREPEILKKLRYDTLDYPNSQMQISSQQGQFLALLVQLMRAKKALEIGVFLGYSGLAIALALPPDGKLIACDIDHKSTAIARQYWQEAKVSDKIELYLAPALETLDKLLNEGQEETFDFVFIDADKRNYDNYYEKSLALLRPGGLIVIDNVLFPVREIQTKRQEKISQALHMFNQKLYDDQRVSISLLPIEDGLTLAFKPY